MNKNTKYMIFLAIFLGQSLVLAGPLHDAVINHDLSEVKRLLENGADVDAYEMDFGPYSPLRLAVLSDDKQTENVAIVKELLKHRANINDKPSSGATAIDMAFYNKRYVYVAVIRKWSIENQVPITDPDDIDLLNRGTPGLYELKYRTYREQIEAAIEEKTRIYGKECGPASIIYGYLGIEETKPKAPQPQKCAHCGY